MACLQAVDRALVEELVRQGIATCRADMIAELQRTMLVITAKLAKSSEIAEVMHDIQKISSHHAAAKEDMERLRARVDVLENKALDEVSVIASELQKRVVNLENNKNKRDSGVRNRVDKFAASFSAELAAAQDRVHALEEKVLSQMRDENRAERPATCSVQAPCETTCEYGMFDTSSSDGEALAGSWLEKWSDLWPQMMPGTRGCWCVRLGLLSFCRDDDGCRVTIGDSGLSIYLNT